MVRLLTHIIFTFEDKEGDKKSQKILQELENIDEECEEKDIDFVKISDEGIEKEYDLPSLPALAFYRHKFRQVYGGDMMHEEQILDWVLDLRTSTPDVIESVDRKTLQVLINDVEHLAVFFCKSDYYCFTSYIWCTLFIRVRLQFYRSIILYFQTTMTVNHARRSWKSLKPSTMTLTNKASSLSSQRMQSLLLRSESSPSQRSFTTKLVCPSCTTVSLEFSTNRTFYHFNISARPSRLSTKHQIDALAHVFFSQYELKFLSSLTYIAITQSI